MKAIRETEKAILVKMICDEAEASNRHEVEVWIPKSQIFCGQISSWIAEKKEAEFFSGIKHDLCYFRDANGEEIEVEAKLAKEQKDSVKSLIADLIAINHPRRRYSKKSA